ncbi:MAG TPA: MucB/RseB C-terminal domain-containing protein [Steroidobacteraceae bacterium]|jgi:sigma-E factor negative regulatory protein RseB|nr:MucB/RseB C-terminal domain-containing protein [Steroidobacteraceae bacterium]
MRSRIRNSERIGWLALALAVAGVAYADEPARWLQRMNHALTTLNYDGTFAHWEGGKVEMLRILHRVEDGTVSERLVSLDGSGREFIRTGSSLTCYLPDKHVVLVEHTPAKVSLLSGFPAINSQTARFYDIKEVARMRFNQRGTHLITVMPRDQYRYGYRLWIDDSTAMPLKTQLCDARGNVIEQLVFANLRIRSHIPDSAFRSGISTTGFQWLRNDSPPLKETVSQRTTVWSADRLPPGFHMTVRAAQIMPGSPGPVDHLVFTDGLASVSVFVETTHIELTPGRGPVMESARVGSSYAFSTVVDGHKVTAVGEVPAQTVRFIADSVKAEKTSESLPPPPVMAPPLRGGPFAHSPPR